MATMLQHFDMLVSKGLKPIAVYKDTKRPIGNDWNKNWMPNKWRDYFKIEQAYSMGVLLGDIVDVEGDTEEANDLLLRIIDGMPHPMFRSSKSIHHLFQNPDPELTRRSFGGIEFRGHAHQSVVPPSVHESGVKYSWLIGSKFPVPPMPAELRRLYDENRKVQKEKKEAYVEQFRPKKQKKLGHTKTQCRICSDSFFIHKKRLMLEVRAFQEKGLPWMCHGCREFDMREPCRIIRKALERPVKFSVRQED